ncbi:hypothetical protein [uncultured Shewanella sp.]|uniref:hypothetical protein n=1 Tax=uncultured Shewanella sp. TaxID=173975 RepID=UPI00262A808A|nr:hypothetical protein [uncultured Shewanella sp.]
MALNMPSIDMASGITVNNPCLVISQLSTSNNLSLSETLDNSNELAIVEGGAHICTFQLSVFASEQAIGEDRPPIDQVRDGYNIHIYQIRLEDELYTDMTPREAAYSYLKTLDEYSTATESTEITTI